MASNDHCSAADERAQWAGRAIWHGISNTSMLSGLHHGSGMRVDNNNTTSEVKGCFMHAWRVQAVCRHVAEHDRWFSLWQTVLTPELPATDGACE